jgi:hypothetical protein
MGCCGGKPIRLWECGFRMRNTYLIRREMKTGKWEKDSEEMKLHYFFQVFENLCNPSVYSRLDFISVEPRPEYDGLLRASKHFSLPDQL